MTKNTSYLVAGDNTGATKIDKARKLGTAVIGEAELIALLMGGAQSATQAEAVTQPPAVKQRHTAVQPNPATQQDLFDF